MASKRDYYEVLGIRRDSTGQEIKSAYRRLAVSYHPDRNPGDRTAEEKFKEAAEAYSVLSDPNQRTRYDQFGHQGVSGGGFGGFDPSTFGDFADILGDFFGVGFGDMFGGGRRRRQGGDPGADLRYQLSLTLEQAAFGTEEALKIPRLETCSTCSGSGSAGESDPSTCSSCGGYGQVRVSQGFFTVARTCPQCRGEGRIITDPCRECHGGGRVEEERSIEVKIPPGVDTGTRLRLSGEGEHGRRGGRTGDLYVDILVEPHPRFEREGPHIRSEIDISYAQAVMGTEVEVETLQGMTTLEIPGGTEHGKEFRLPGKGVQRLDGRGHGDHYARIRLDVPHPRDLSDEQIDLLEQLAKVEGKEIRGERGVLHRVRDLFG
jgi:molecular chaperone DnaJ